MSLVLEIDAFSGRPNPTVELDDDEVNDVVERLRPQARLAPVPDLTPPSYLGYRGVIVRGADAYVPDLPDSFRLLGETITGPGLAHQPADIAVEELITGPEGPFRRLEEPELLARLRELVPSARREIYEWPWWKYLPWPWVNPCECAPLYEPAWWNVPARQPVNNCYNYATNYRTDTFAQPGKAAGAEYTSFTCADVSAAALADDLIADATESNTCPANGHLVALVIDPGWDFHWYRKGKDGMWTHKPGSTPVTNVDNSGNAIADPRTANRGPYTDFCTFMIVMHGHIKIA
jgi:hypothetical protein